MWFTNITPSDVTYKKELGLSDYAEVLLVDIRGHTCVMKVVSQHLFPYYLLYAMLEVKRN